MELDGFGCGSSVLGYRANDWFRVQDDARPESFVWIQEEAEPESLVSSSGCFLCGSDFELQIWPDRNFTCGLFKLTQWSYAENRIYCVCGDPSKSRDQLRLLWSGAAKRRAGCVALRVVSKRPSQR